MKQFKIISSILCVVCLIFIARVAYFQLFTEKYKLNAENTSIKPEYQIPLRGYIMDRKGKILVGNTPSYEMSYTEAYLGKDFDTIGFCKLIGISKEVYVKKIEEIKTEKGYAKIKPMVFIKNLDNNDLAKIQEKLFKYTPFSIVRRPERNYLVNTSGNILGYINEVNDKYIKSDSLYYMMGNLAGMAGVEKSYEKNLRGIKGIKYIQKDRLLKSIGSYKNGEYDIQMKSGDDIMLTIDYDLQNLAESLFTNKRGGVVAIDPNTGEILAMVSSPVINPSLFVGKNKNKNIVKMQLDSMQKPMYDRAVQAMYPPGSTFKLVNALAGMQMKVIDSTTTFTCRHGFIYGNRKINCHCGYYFTPISILKATQKSCNNYFAETYVKILNKYPNDIEKGIDEWSEILNSFGLGKYFKNDLAVGSSGNIPNAKYYNKRYGKRKWNTYTIISNSIGQGEILLTPLQIANFTAVIANKGFYYTPHIAKEINGLPIQDTFFTKPKYTKVDKVYFNSILNGMKEVIVNGTGRRINNKIFSQAGKTGTSQNPHGNDHSIFVLIAPAENPQIVIAAVVENGGFGATYAGPICSLIAEKYLTDSIARKPLLDHVINADFRGEYQKQWEIHLKRYGSSIKKLDSIKRLKNDLSKFEGD